MKKKTLLLTTLAGTMLVAGMTLSGVNAATESQVVINEQEAEVAVKVQSGTNSLDRATLEDMIEAEYENKELDVTARVQGETAGTGAKVELTGNLSDTKELTVILYGDVTGDGVIDMTDSTAVLLHSLGKKELTGISLTAADVEKIDDTEEVKVNMSDSTRILLYSLNKMDEVVDSTKVLTENIKVHEHTYSYTQIDGENRHNWTCSECDKTGVEDCTFGEWNSEDGKVAKRTCTKCGREETKNLVEVLNDTSVTELTVKAVNTADAALTVPVGKTLTVSDKVVTNTNKVTVNGKLVLKKPQTSLKLDGTGTVVYAPDVENAKDFATAFPTMTTILSGIKVADEEAAKSLKYEINVPELEEPQTITDTAAITLHEGFDLTVDLGNNTLETKDTNNTFITNKGDLTLRNGTVKIPDNSKKFVIGSDSNITATLNLENVEIIGCSGISTNGNLVMNGGKIESNGTANDPRALQISGSGDNIKAVTTELKDVDIITNRVGIVIGKEPFHDLVMTGGSITVKTADDSRNAAIWSNSQYSSITLDGTKITSQGMGIYLQNNGGFGANKQGGNVAHLNNVTIKSEDVCIWTCETGDKVEVTGGSYTSTKTNAIRINSRELNTLKDCYVQGAEDAIKVLGSLLVGHNFSDYVQKTNVNVVDL